MPSFITDEDQVLFNARFHPRHARSGPDASLLPIKVFVTKLVKTRERLQAAAEKSAADDGKNDIDFLQAALVLKVHHSDGLTWLAEDLVRLVKEKLGRCEFVPLKGERSEYQLPEIVRHIGLRKSERLFARNGLYNDRRWRHIAVNAAMIAGAVLLTLLVAYLSKLAAEPTRVVIVATALLGVVAAVLGNQFKWQRDPKALQALTALVDDQCEDPTGRRSPQMEQAIDAFATALVSLSKPRCVIVDNYAMVDEFTKAVMRGALAKVSAGGGDLYWFILEHAEDGEFSRELAVNPKYSGRNIETVTIEPLTLAERQQVLKAHELPIGGAKDETYLKLLIKGASLAEVDQLHSILEGLVRIEADTQGLRASTVFHVIALNGNQPRFSLSVERYVSLFSEKGEGRRLFPILVAAYLQLPPVAKDHAREVIGLLQTRLERLMMGTTSPADGLRVRAAAADVARRMSSQFPAPAIELFWFLHWFRIDAQHLGATALQRKLAQHAQQARLDRRMLALADGQAIGLELILALVRLTEACLQSTLFREAQLTSRALLVNLRELLSAPAGEVTPLTSVHWAGIARVGWQVYLATGSESFLVDLLSILADAKLPALEQHRPADAEMVTAFLRVHNVAESEVDGMAGALGRLIGREATIGLRLRAHMHCRVLEIMRLCEQFSSSQVVSAMGLPTSTALTTSIDRSALINICDNIYNDIERPFTIFDNLVLRDALRYVVAEGDTDAAKAIVPAFTLAPTARTGGAFAGRRLSLLEQAFRIHTVANCLDGLLQLAARNTSRDRPEYQVGRGDPFRFRINLSAGLIARDLNDVIRQAAEEFGGRADAVAPAGFISPTVLTRVSDLYANSAVAWEELGLDHLRNRVLMDRALFLLEFTDADPRVPASFGPILEALGPALATAGLPSVLYHLELASFFGSVPNLMSTYITQALHRLLRLGADSDLTLLFCTFLNHLPVRVAELQEPVSSVLESLADPPLFARFTTRFGLDADILPSFANSVMEVGRLSGDSSLQLRAMSMVNDLMASAALSEHVAGEVKLMQRIQLLKMSPVPATDTEIGAVLDEWEPYTDRWFYAVVLQHLMGSDSPSARLVDTALRALERSDGVWQGNVAIRIAIRVGNFVAAGEHAGFRDRVLNLLIQQAAPRVSDWDFELATWMYEVLMDLDPDNRLSYRDSHAQFTALKIERDRTESYSRMLRAGHYFGVLHSYWNSLRIYLPRKALDASWFEAYTQLRTHDSPKSEVREFCVRRMQTAPPQRLIAEVDGKAVVLIDAMVVGEVLSDPDPADGPEVVEFRDALNEMAVRDLKHFLELVQETPSVPPALREFIREHRASLVEEMELHRHAA